jgi:AcrR family transcriptional regulator
MKRDSPPTRNYRQKARATAAAETGMRILDAFIARLQVGWFEEIRLDDVAADAGVTVQTVIRRFGGKEGLLESANEKVDHDILEERQLPVGDVAKGLDAIIAQYEKRGDFMMRMLAQEDRYASIRELTDHGRAVHRRWTGEVFAPWLERFDGVERRYVHDRLMIAFDLYVWKLVRVDMKRSKAELGRTMLEMAADALGTTTEDLLQPRDKETIDA